MKKQNHFRLFGDGINDDTPAIQEMLDSGKRIVYLPMPQKYYSINQTLWIHSNQTLVLPENAKIRLADGANTTMLQNSGGEDGDENIAVIGGIWDINNMGQNPHGGLKRQETKEDSVYVSGPDHPTTCTEDGNIRKTFPGKEGSGHGMTLENINGLTLLNITYVNPTCFCAAIGSCCNFHVENIVFDFNDMNPLPATGDGIHLEGGCHDGLIRHLRGTTYDDMVALNADERIRGDMYHIVIDDLYARHGHSAVRMLTSGHRIYNIHISNIRGSYFTYCVGFTKYYQMGNGIPGCFENITICDCEFTKSDILPWFRNIDYPLIYFQTETQVTGLHLKNIHRTCCGRMTDLFGVEDGAYVEGVTMENVIGDMALDAQNIDEFLALSHTGKPKIALQLYTLRRYLGAELPQTLQRIKEMGYDGVEYHGLDGRTPEEISQLSKEAGLEIFSLFTNIDEILTVDDCYLNRIHAAGFQYLVLGYLPAERLAGGELFEETCSILRNFAIRVKACGMTFLYHNHDFDLAPVTGSEKRALDIMMDAFPADALGLEPDTCWLYSGGVDVNEYLQTYQKRSPLIHLKDCVREGGRKEFRAIGRGVLDFPVILKDCAHAQWVCVEQDEPSEGMDEFECAAMSIANLRAI